MFFTLIGIFGGVGTGIVRVGTGIQRLGRVGKHGWHIEPCKPRGQGIFLFVRRDEVEARLVEPIGCLIRDDRGEIGNTGLLQD